MEASFLQTLRSRDKFLAQALTQTRPTEASTTPLLGVELSGALVHGCIGMRSSERVRLKRAPTTAGPPGQELGDRIAFEVPWSQGREPPQLSLRAAE